MTQSRILRRTAALAFLCLLALVSAQAAAPVITPDPTYADVAYGPFPSNRLDFWQASSASPTPVIVYIHGGGFTKGDKSQIRTKSIVKECLRAGVSFAAIDYRYLGAAPIQDILRDCARAIQFIRYKSADWNVDKARIGSYGESAGAGSSLWLDFHDDLADPDSSDPVLRESSRLACVVAIETQCSFNVERWSQLFSPDVLKKFGGMYTPALLYGIKTQAENEGPEGKMIRTDCDMLGLISKGASAVLLISTRPSGEPKDGNQFLHDPRHAELVYKRCKEVGVPVVAHIPALGIEPGLGETASFRDFLFEHLGVTPPVPVLR